MKWMTNTVDNSERHNNDLEVINSITIKFEKLIGAPVSEDGTGRAEAISVIEVLQKLNIKCQICYKYFC